MPPPRKPLDGPAEPFAALPDPGRAASLDDLVRRLRLLKIWAGDPSYECIKDRVNTAWASAGWSASDLVGKTTVVDCFRTGRRRLNSELVVAIVQALHPDVGYVTQWRQALRVVGGESRAAAQVRVQDRLPPGVPVFTGRSTELVRLRAAADDVNIRDTMAVAVIDGMAGVGKTQLAVRAAHSLCREGRFERILYVNLRGCHPDPTQPPVTSAAVLDGFLRLLGVAGQRIPHDPAARSAAFRDRLAGARTLVVLDDAADEEQIRLLIPDAPGSMTLITSRRSLTGLDRATQVSVGSFEPEEAVCFLRRAAAGVPVGPDPHAANRIAERCAHLPLALGLVVGHIHGTADWTLTDHADRLDEQHRDRCLERGMELALDVSYRRLPDDQRRLLRLAVLHPGQDFDIYAAAALTGADLADTCALLRLLHRDHLLQRTADDRYTFHDLVRAYAANRGTDEDAPAWRRAALTRLFDFYLATAAAAMDILAPAEAHRRPRTPPAATPMPALTDLDRARAWLDTERHTLVAVAAHTATHGWPAYTTRLSPILWRYLASGHQTDALAIHRHAYDAARRSANRTGQAHASLGLGVAKLQLGRYRPADRQLRRALTLFQRAGDRTGQARALNALGITEQRQGRYESASEHYERARALFERIGDQTGHANALGNLGFVLARLGRCPAATDHFEQALALFQRIGDRTGEAIALSNLGDVASRQARYAAAAEYLQRALTLCRRLGHRTGEGWTLDNLGTLHMRLGQPGPAADHYRQALTAYRETGDLDGEAWGHNGLGEAATIDGRPADALAHHLTASTIATRIGARDQQARAHRGLSRAHYALGNAGRAHEHGRLALCLYLDLGMPEAEQLRVHLVTVGEPPHDDEDAER
jgi:tetratricopeptide (TPR) repeat protein